MSEIAIERKIEIPAGRWVIDHNNSRIGFTVRHVGINQVKGRFDRFQGEMVVGDNLAEAKMSVDIIAASINSGQSDRDRHLMSDDFLDADKYPQISFRSIAIEPRQWGELMVIGELSMHGQTNQLELDGELHGISEDEQGNQIIALGLQGSLSRADYGMEFNRVLGGGNLLVGDRVDIEIDVAALLVS